MKEITPPLETTKDFEKVYETPLNWCPVFGYIPAIENTHLTENVEPFEIGMLCKKTIIEARILLLELLNIPEAYHYTENNVALPKIKSSVWLNNECKAVRNLFRNLDYLALCTSNNQYIINLRSCGVINKFSPTQKPIGRISNLDINVTALSCAVGIINLNDEDIHVHEKLLCEAQKITGQNIDLNLEILFALFAILESWLVLTSLLLKPEMHQQIRRIFKMQQKAQYGTDLLNKAYSHGLEEHINFLSRDFRTNFKEKQKISENKKAQGERAKKASKQRKSIKEVFQIAINDLKKDNPAKNADKLYEFIFKKYCVDDDLVLRFCGNDASVINKFYRIEIGMDEYYLYCMPDIVEPDDPLKSCLYLIKNKDYETKSKPRTFGTYYSEYFYKRKSKREKAK